MKKSMRLHLVFGGLLIAALHAAPAHAQATRTWVSGSGNDMNPCSYTSPCQTFAGAISKTAPGGEISVMNSAAYGTVTITKAITINGEGSLAGILASSGSAITVAAASTDKVILRNLQLNGAGGGNTGVNISSGSVTIDKCMIYGFTAGFIGGLGVFVNSSSTLNVDIRDTDITNSSFGVWVQSASGFAIATLDNVRINGTPGAGVAAASTNASVTVNRSYIVNAGSAVITSSGNSVINVNDSVLTNNTTAVNASASGSTIRLSNTALFDNTTGLSTGAGATIATASNNKAAGNGGALTTNGTVSNF